MPERILRKIFVIHPSPLVTDFQAHGDGLLAHRYILELAKRGHRIVVACEAVELRAPFPDNVTLHPIVTGMSRFGLLARPAYAIAVRRLFDRIDRIERFDVAHQFNPVVAGLSLGFAGLDIPVILGPYVAHWPFKRTSRVKTIALDTLTRVQQRFATALILSGEAARSRVVGRSPAQIYTVPYGIDLDQFPETPFPAGDPVLLYVGGLSSRKGILVFLEAFETIVERIPDVQLLVVGDGPERDAVRTAVASSRHAARIRLIGSIPRDRVPEIIAQSTLFCLPSYGEPYGMSLLEAMAMGRPVVATAIGGPAHLVTGAGGRLVPPGDPAAFARAVVELLQQPDLLASMGAFNREATRQFAWPAVIDSLEDVYTSVLSTHPRKVHAK